MPRMCCKWLDTQGLQGREACAAIYITSPPALASWRVAAPCANRVLFLRSSGRARGARARVSRRLIHERPQEARELHRENELRGRTAAEILQRLEILQAHRV